MNNKGTILVIDDNHLILRSISVLLEEHGFTSIEFQKAGDALEAVDTLMFDAVLTDIKMPQITGIELLERLKQADHDRPVVMMTAHAELETAVKAINKGAFDFIIKPFTPEYLINTIKKAVEYTRLRESEQNYKKRLESIVQLRTKELREALHQTEKLSREIIKRLTTVAEFRDTDTGNHISRIGLYSNKLAETLNLHENFIEHITVASTMHDIGKIGIPDYILLKPDRLTPEEFNIMKTHTSIGKNILDGSSNPVIKMASSIAANHHERWDGTGYPAGLKGKDISIEGMIVMIVDQYDALRSKRPYKSPMSHENALDIIVSGDGRTIPGHFAPDVLSAFIETADVFNEIYTIYNGFGCSCPHG